MKTKANETRKTIQKREGMVIPTHSSKLVYFGSESAFVDIEDDEQTHAKKLAVLTKSIIGLQRAVSIAKTEDESFLQEEADEALAGIELISSFAAGIADMLEAADLRASS